MEGPEGEERGTIEEKNDRMLLRREEKIGRKKTTNKPLLCISFMTVGRRSKLTEQRLVRKGSKADPAS